MFKQVVFLSLVSFLVSCAQQVAPTGGLKDEQAPEILSIEPEQEKLNYQNEEIEIEFDEFIQLNQLKQQFISSPPLKHPLETEVKGKKLSINIEDTLEENTTYVLNFGNAIVDYHESNPIENFKYVFSTGNVIDTLSISGIVINAFELTPVEGAIVALYKSASLDSLPYQKIPDYVDRTNKEGEFNLSNLKQGDYSLFVVKDENSNFLFDKPEEEIAFSDTLISLREPIEGLKYYSFIEDHQKQYVKTQSEEGAHVVLEFNKGIDTLSFDFLDSLGGLLYSEISKGKDSLELWFKENGKQSYEMQLFASPAYEDTLSLKLNDFKDTSLKVLNKPNGEQDFFKSYQLQFNRPIASFNQDGIRFFKKDSTELSVKLEIDSMHTQWMKILAELKQDSAYFLTIDSGAVKDIYDYSNDSLRFDFRINSIEDFGNLALKVNMADSSEMLVQLLDQNQKVLKQKIAEDHAVVFKHLRAGSYQIKLILDANANGLWDTGVLLQSIQAEKVYLYDEKITIRANWDQEIEWVIK
tara:strand:- start:12703 stop:14277 length:1575 start_codon:yes stop_codon:yes gene_type:complete